MTTTATENMTANMPTSAIPRIRRRSFFVIDIFVVGTLVAGLAVTAQIDRHHDGSPLEKPLQFPPRFGRCRFAATVGKEDCRAFSPSLFR